MSIFDKYAMAPADLPTESAWPAYNGFKLPGRGPYDGRHVKGVTAYALCYGGEVAGRIVANYSDGGRVTAGVFIYGGPLKGMPSTWGLADGGGYCKFSAAVSDALGRPIPTKLPAEWDAFNRARSALHGAGERAVEAFFESLGYAVSRIV